MDVCQLSIDEAVRFFDGLELDEMGQKIAADVVREITSRLGFLQNVGLGYLTLNRTSGTLSGGEAQRIRLATQIGAGLVRNRAKISAMAVSACSPPDSRVSDCRRLPGG